MKTEHIYDTYEELTKINKNSTADRARGAAMIMEQYGDKEMADTLRLLSCQLDFDDSIGANDAIKRTNETLDKLIDERKKRHSFSYMEMMTDDMVLQLSGGEVTESGYSSITSSFLENGLFDPAIFGGSGKIPYFNDEKNRYNLDEYGTGMGHIKLPCHVVFESSYRIIAFLLGQTYENIEKLAKCVSVAVIDPGKSDLEVGTILTDKEYNDYDSEDIKVKTGGDAIYDMLKALNYSDQPERLAFCILPVASPSARPIAYSLKDCVYCCDPVNRIYEKIIYFSNRLKKLLDMNTPFIIVRNEMRMLNDAVNELDQFVTKYNSKHCGKRNVFAIHDFYQRSIIRRRIMINAIYIPSEKTGEIESLGIYPETIRVQSEDGTYDDILLSDIVDACDDAMWTFEQDHAIVTPDGVDPDHLPDDLQAESDEAAEIYNNMQSTLDAILDGAKLQRETFTVRMEDSGMYVPV